MQASSYMARYAYRYLNEVKVTPLTGIIQGHSSSHGASLGVWLDQRDGLLTDSMVLGPVPQGPLVCHNFETTFAFFSI